MTENKETERGLTIHTDAAGADALQTVLEKETENAEIVEPTQEMVDDALSNMPTNIPYTRILNDEGELANPITKGNPYLSPFMNRRQKKEMIRKATRHPKNNKRGIRLVVTPFAKGKFVKTKVEKQQVGWGLESDSINGEGKLVRGTKLHRPRTIIHNVTQL